MRSVDDIFPSQRIAFVHGAVGACESQLLESEQRAIASAIEGRRHQYASVRVCARQAMRQLGVAPAPILNREDRSPVWPRGVVGSLSHTRRHCGAAVALSSHVTSVGIDIESDEDLPVRLWRRVCTTAELEHLESVGSGRLARATFCVKECFYKYQFPLTGCFLGFSEVEAEIDLEAGEFRIRLEKAAGEFRAGAEFSGRVVQSGGLLVAGMASFADRD